MEDGTLSQLSVKQRGSHGHTPRIHPGSLKLANSQEENISLLHNQNILLSHAAVAFIKCLS